MQRKMIGFMGVMTTLALVACGTSHTTDEVSAMGKEESLTLEEQCQAILAMAGNFDVTFRFEETVPMQANYVLKAPYVTQGSEKVVVLEDSPKRISLQHLLVVDDHVVKHWRQDWEYEQTQFWQYLGDYTWGKREVSPEEVKDTWVQTVWQVDDSPRYAGIGRWQKQHGVVSWESDASWRPLPRREYSQRHDYDVLVTVNRHVITPQGWVHEQDSQKLKTIDDTVLAKEHGVNTYQRNPTLDFSKAEQYWQETKAYWQAMRQVWEPLVQQDKVALVWPEDEKQAHFSAIARDAMQQTKALHTAEELHAAAKQALTPFLISPKEAVGQLSVLAQ